MIIQGVAFIRGRRILESGVYLHLNFKRCGAYLIHHLEEIQHKIYGMVNGMVKVIVKRNLRFDTKAGIYTQFCFFVVEEKPRV